MFKYAAFAVAGLTLFTAVMVVFALLGDDKPTFNVAAAGQVFERYPFWQRSAVASTEVVLDLQFSNELSDIGSAPAAFTEDALAQWQRAGKQDLVLEFGVERLGAGNLIVKE